MAPSSSDPKTKSRRELESRVWKEFVGKLAKSNSPRDVEIFLNTFITIHEKKQILKRLAAVPLLNQGKSYRQIGDILWLSPTTISAVKKAINSKRYISTYNWKQVNKLVRKLTTKQVKSSPPRRRELDPKKYILPHGKLVHPIRRDRRVW